MCGIVVCVFINLIHIGRSYSAVNSVQVMDSGMLFTSMPSTDFILAMVADNTNGNQQQE
jgi:hypothetical protein